VKRGASAMEHLFLCLCPILPLEYYAGKEAVFSPPVAFACVPDRYDFTNGFLPSITPSHTYFELKNLTEKPYNKRILNYFKKYSPKNLVVKNIVFIFEVLKK